MNPSAPLILHLPCGSSFIRRYAFRKDLLRGLRRSELPVVVVVSGRQTLDCADINLLLDCVAQAAGQDTELLMVAGSAVIRILLDVTRVSSLVPVFESTAQAIAYSRPTAAIDAMESPSTQLQLLRSA